jgi:hypothetical protein
MRYASVPIWLGALCFVAGCSRTSAAHSERTGFDMAFSETRPRVPETVAYFDKVVSALDDYLRKRGFQTTTKPEFANSNGYVFLSQRESWYVRRDKDSPAMYVEIRHATANWAGLTVNIQWQLYGTTKEIDAVDARASELRADLYGWWDSYEHGHPQPIVPW